MLCMSFSLANAWKKSHRSEGAWAWAGPGAGPGAGPDDALKRCLDY